MAHPPVPNNNPQQQLKFELVSYSGNQAIIRVEGQDYKFTVYKGQGANWVDITGKRDWTQLAQHVTELFLKTSANVTKIDSGEVILAGDFADVESDAQLAEKNVTFVSAKVKREGRETPISRLEIIPSETRPIVEEKIRTIGRDFASIRPLASSREGVQNAPPAPVEEFEDIVKNELLDLCTDRPLLDIANPIVAPSAEQALAQQLILIPNVGTSNYNGLTVANLAPILKTAAAAHIVTNKYWNTPSNFSEIFTALQKAHAADNAALEAARGVYTTKSLGKIRKKQDTALTSGALGTLLGQDLQAMSKTDKERLVRLYATYLENPTTQIKELSVAKPFFKAFMEIHRSSAKGDNFQIVIVSEAANGKKSTEVYSGNEPTVETRRCAFLYLKDGQFRCYNRAADQNHNTNNLDEPGKRVVTTSSTERKKKPTVPRNYVATTVPIINIDASGQCLDTSIAYQIQKKAGDANPLSNKQQLINHAEELRRTVSTYIANTEALNNDMDFVYDLVESVNGIPQESVPQPVQNATKLARKPISSGISSQIEQNIRASRTILRTFYAQYIIKTDAQLKMTNYLAEAFINVLSKIALPNQIQGSFPNGLKVAIIQGDRIIRKIPEHLELQYDDWIFVDYNGVDHYHVVNLTDPTTPALVKAMIKREKISRLQEIYDLLLNLSTSGATLRLRLANIKDQYPEGYIAIKRALYQHEHTLWQRSDHRLPEPRDDNLINRLDNNEQYADYRIRTTINDDQFKAMLTPLAPLLNQAITDLSQA